MTAGFVSRRRAEEFHSLVESSTTDSAAYAEVLELVASMRALDAPAPRPEFVASLREQLMTAADTVLVATPAERLTLPPRRTHRERRIAAVVGGAAIVGATTSMALAAQTALPGDMLYPVKRAIENAHTGLSVGDGAKGTTMLANASGRLDEISALSRSGGFGDVGELTDTLNTFTDQASEAGDLLLQDYAETGDETSIVELRDFTAASMKTLAALEADLPAEARNAMVHAARVLTQIDVAAQQACPQCAGDGIDEIPANLASGGLSTPQVPVVPAQNFTASPPRSSKGSKGSKDQGAKETKKGGSQTPSVPEVEPAEATQPSGSTGGQTAGGDDSDPVKDLTDTVTGGGSEPASQPSGLPGLPDADDLTQGVSDPLKP